MSIDPIAFTSALSAEQLQGSGIQAGTRASFQDTLRMGVREVNQQMVDAEQGITALALGDDIPPHQVVMALEEARLSLQFALQVRARLIEGYQELLRMQI